MISKIYKEKVATAFDLDLLTILNFMRVPYHSRKWASQETVTIPDPSTLTYFC
jgi:hypothetical protein